MAYKILYHVTKKRYVQKILKKGIRRTRSIFAVTPREIKLLRMKVSDKKRLYERWKEQFVYLTDKRGAGVIARHWVECKYSPVILKVRVPEEWLDMFSGSGKETWYSDYRYRNPKALEWAVDRVIPPEYIIDIFDGC